MDANGLEQNVVLSQLKQCRSHMLTQRKRRQKNRLICIQLRLLRTRFEIKDTWIENDFDLFLGGGGGEEVRWKTVRTYGKILATPLPGVSCTFHRIFFLNKTTQNTLVMLHRKFLRKKKHYYHMFCLNLWSSWNWISCSESWKSLFPIFLMFP